MSRIITDHKINKVVYRDIMEALYLILSNPKFKNKLKFKFEYKEADDKTRLFEDINNCEWWEGDAYLF
jgi:hypothetical protein